MRQAATRPRKQPTQRRSRETVEALLVATARVLVRDGYDRASTNRIAQVAGVSVGSLYQYFPSKEALVAALIDREIDLQMRVVSEKLDEVVRAPLAAAARSLVEAVVLAHRVHPKLHKILTEEVPRVGALKRIVELEARLVDLLVAGLRLRAHEIRAADLDVVAFVLVHTVEGVVHGAINGRPGLLDENALVDELTCLVLRYLAL